jgi:hypothetical protein
MTVVDWNSLMKQAQQSAALPGADYDMVVVSCDAVNASTGKLMYKTRMAVESGGYQGRHLTNNFVISPDSPTALRIFFRHMNAFGLDANFFASNPAPDTVASSMVGRRALVTLGLRKWRGEDQNEIVQVSPPRGAPSGMPGTGVPPVTVPQGGITVPQAAVPQPVAPVQPVEQVVQPVQQVIPTPAPQPEPVVQQVPVPEPQPVAQQVPVPQPEPVPQPQPQQPIAPTEGVPMKWIINAQGQPEQVPDTDATPQPAPQQPVPQAAEVPQPTAPPPVPY